MKVSIIIPVYNAEPYIETCLLSALNQTYQDLEVILVDDCGQDKSMEVARRVIDRHPNGHKVTILKQEQNSGPSAARNTGISAATGMYLYFLDSDDEITVDCLDILVSSCENDDIVIGNLFSDGKENTSCVRKRYTGQENLLNAFFQREIHFYNCNKLLLRDFIVKNNLYYIPGMLHEDLIWTYKSLLCADSVYTIPDNTYKYTLRNNGITNTMSSKKIHDLIVSVDYINENIPPKNRNSYAATFIIDTKYTAKSHASSMFSYKDFKELHFADKGWLVKGVSWACIFKFYFVESPAIFQYSFFKLYHSAKKIARTFSNK